MKHNPCGFWVQWVPMEAKLVGFLPPCTDLRYRGGIVHSGKGEPAAFGVRVTARGPAPGHWVGWGGTPVAEDGLQAGHGRALDDAK